MHNRIKIPYGNTYLTYKSNDGQILDQILPREDHISKKQEVKKIANSLQNCIGLDEKKLYNHSSLRVAIAVNDSTRPTPNNLLLPPLLKKIGNFGIPSENISLFIATGTHKRPSEHEIFRILSLEKATQYRVIAHDCDDSNNLTFLGHSETGTPIFINKEYFLHDIKLVVGQIEPHHFMGFSGGVKSAVIGLGGRKTIEVNHSKILDPMAKMGIFYDNPMRKEVEEIGKIIGVNIAFNVILNSEKQIVDAFYGDPYKVMVKGIKASAGSCQVESDGEYDLVIASPGGHPKDINFYQSQKAITHACTFLKKNGVVILAAACTEGPGCEAFEIFFKGKHSPLEVINSFENQEFKIGPHKAYQLALQLKDHPIIIISEMKPITARSILLTPARDISEAISISKDFLPEMPRIATLPYATHTILKNRSGE